MLKIYRQSPLMTKSNDKRAEIKAGTVFVTETPFIRKHLLIGRAPTGQGFVLPETANVLTGNSRTFQSARLAPGQWLLLGVDGSVLRDLRQAYNQGSTHVVDVTDNYQMFDIGGVDAVALLATGCSLDLRSKSFSINQCAKTLIERIPVILIRKQEKFIVMVERPHTLHLWAWFKQVSQEFR